jgi:hypothetical protein
MAVLGRVSRASISFIQVLENSCDGLGLGDEGEDAKSAAAGTEEGDYRRYYAIPHDELKRVLGEHKRLVEK